MRSVGGLLAVLYSTRAKLLAVLLPVIALATLVSLGGLSVFLERFFRQHMQAQVATLAGILTASLKQQMLGRVEDLTQRTLEDIGTAGDIRSIRIVDTRGRVTHAYPAAERGRVLQPTREPGCQTCHVGAGRPVQLVALTSEPSGTHVLRVAAPLVNEARCQGCHGGSARLNGVLLIERTAAGEQRALGTIRRRFVGTWVVTLGTLSVLIVGATTVLVHRPVRRLIDGARRIGGGDLAVRVSVPVRGELRELAASFNGMTTNLAASIEEVRHKNLELSVLYTMVTRISRTVFVGELKPLILEVVAEVLHAPRVILVSPTGERDELEILVRESHGVDRHLLRPGDIPHAPLSIPAGSVAAWTGGGMTEVALDDGGALALLPLTFQSHDLALLVITAPSGRTFTGEDLRLMGAVRDNVSVALENARLYTLAITDELTQLYSIRHFQVTLEAAVGRFERYGEPVALLMLDLDRFKAVNDAHGHPAGDRVLKEIAHRIRASVREVDIACRYGGEEFAVILPHTDDRAARVVAERVRLAVATPVALPNLDDVSITISIGIAACPRDATTTRDLVGLADQALYAAKRGGRNRVCSAGSVDNLT